MFHIAYFYMLNNRYHYSYINVFGDYSCFMFDGFICTKGYSNFGVPEYIWYDWNMSQWEKLTRCFFIFKSLNFYQYRAFCYLI
jgi:hypothetical protein